jgi:hypothetical protein
VNYGQEKRRSLCPTLFSDFNPNWKLPVSKPIQAVLELNADRQGLTEAYFQFLTANA